MRKIGKIGKANIKSRQIIAEISEEKGLNYCELRMEGCLGGSFLAPAHRHLRAWYQGDVELLSDYDQWLCACVNCHTTLDSRSQTSQEESDAIFNKLRP